MEFNDRFCIEVLNSNHVLKSLKIKDEERNRIVDDINFFVGQFGTDITSYNYYIDRALSVFRGLDAKIRERAYEKYANGYRAVAKKFRVSYSAGLKSYSLLMDKIYYDSTLLMNQSIVFENLSGVYDDKVLDSIEVSVDGTFSYADGDKKDNYRYLTGKVVDDGVVIRKHIRGIKADLDSSSPSVVYDSLSIRNVHGINLTANNRDEYQLYEGSSSLDSKFRTNGHVMDLLFDNCYDLIASIENGMKTDDIKDKYHIGEVLLFRDFSYNKKMGD